MGKECKYHAHFKMWLILRTGQEFELHWLKVKDKEYTVSSIWEKNSIFWAEVNFLFRFVTCLKHGSSYRCWNYLNYVQVCPSISCLFVLLSSFVLYDTINCLKIIIVLRSFARGLIVLCCSRLHWLVFSLEFCLIRERCYCCCFYFCLFVLQKNNNKVHEKRSTNFCCGKPTPFQRFSQIAIYKTNLKFWMSKAPLCGPAHLFKNGFLNCWLQNFFTIDIVFQRPYRSFSITLKVIFSLSDRYKIFTNDWL